MNNHIKIKTYEKLNIDEFFSLLKEKNVKAAIKWQKNQYQKWYNSRFIEYDDYADMTPSLQKLYKGYELILQQCNQIVRFLEEASYNNKKIIYQFLDYCSDKYQDKYMILCQLSSLAQELHFSPCHSMKFNTSNDLQIIETILTSNIEASPYEIENNIIQIMSFKKSLNVARCFEALRYMLQFEEYQNSLNQLLEEDHQALLEQLQQMSWLYNKSDFDQLNSFYSNHFQRIEPKLVEETQEIVIELEMIKSLSPYEKISIYHITAKLLEDNANELTIKSYFNSETIQRIHKIFLILQKELGIAATYKFIEQLPNNFIVSYYLQYYLPQIIENPNITNQDICKLYKNLGYCDLKDINTYMDCCLIAVKKDCLQEFLEYTSPYNEEQNERKFFHYQNPTTFETSGIVVGKNEPLFDSNKLLKEITEFFNHNLTLLQNIMTHKMSKIILQNLIKIKKQIELDIPTPELKTFSRKDIEIKYGELNTSTPWIEYGYYTTESSESYMISKFPIFEIFQIKEAINFIIIIVFLNIEKDSLLENLSWIKSINNPYFQKYLNIIYPSNKDLDTLKLNLKAKKRIKPEEKNI